MGTVENLQMYNLPSLCFRCLSVGTSSCFPSSRPPSSSGRRASATASSAVSSLRRSSCSEPLLFPHKSKIIRLHITHLLVSVSSSVFRICFIVYILISSWLLMLFSRLSLYFGNYPVLPLYFGNYPVLPLYFGN